MVPRITPNTAKCEIGKWCKCGTLWNEMSLSNERTVKKLGVHFSYNKKLEHKINFWSHIVKIESILMLWHMRNLTIEGKVLVFKSLAISEIVHLSLITTIPDAIINQVKNINKSSYGTGKIQK